MIADVIDSAKYSFVADIKRYILNLLDDTVRFLSSFGEAVLE